MSNCCETLKKGEIKEIKEKQEIKECSNEERCPVCGNKKLAHEGGCLTCYFCGWSKCS